MVRVPLMDGGGYQFEFVGGALCLDFCNTLSGRTDESPREHLNEYADLVEWARQGNILPEARARRLLAEATRHPAATRRTFAEAIALREAMAAVFAALAAGHKPAAAEVARINAALPRALAHLEIAPTADGFGWSWREDDDAPDCMLWPAIRSAADLLLAGPGKLRICEME